MCSYIQFMLSPSGIAASERHFQWVVGSFFLFIQKTKNVPSTKKKNINSAALWSVVDEFSLYRQPKLHLKPSSQSNLLSYYDEFGSKAVFRKLQHCCKNLCWCRISKVSITVGCLKTFFELGVIPWQKQICLFLLSCEMWTHQSLNNI